MPPKKNLTEIQRERYNENKRKRAATTRTNKGSRNQKWIFKAQLKGSSSTNVNDPSLDFVEGDFEPECSDLHVLKKVPSCEYCGAKKLEYEPPSFCCSNGNVLLAPPLVPDELYQLFTSHTPEAIDFRKYIRVYNSMFSFTSFGVRVDKELANAKGGIFTFRAQGQVYHELPSILAEKDNPCYMQLYFYDTDHELQNRMKKVQDSKDKVPIVSKLMDILSRNPYTQFFRSLKDVPSLEDRVIIIKSDIRLDQRVYNAPSADQVAAIWIEGNNPNMKERCDIVIQGHSGSKHRVKHYYGCYDALQYPLLFPNGEVGWHRRIKKGFQASLNPQYIATEEDAIFNGEDDNDEGFDDQKKDRISPRAYYCHKLQIRDADRSILLYSCRLLHQYVVDMYIKIEATRLDYYRSRQSNIRAELYQGIVDSVSSGQTKGAQIGKKVILPASFIGGPRDMRRRYLDALSLVQHFGKPDLFITMTCNPDWLEIHEELKLGQTSQDRPDLTARVFRAKLQDLKDQLFKKCIFGKVAAHVHVIEFQKRGLPHAHILIIFQKDDKISNPDIFDKYVCAEIPNPQEHQDLYEKVVRHMMHGPCGDLNRRNACMRNGVCKNRYPRMFTQTTMQCKDSYPIYRRRNNGRQVLVRNHYLDNRWVVPYNPYLLTRYDCHINVEICSGLKAVKYLYKYVYKGHDRVAVSLSHNNEEYLMDEIKQYRDARWVSAQEAMWRIYEFNLNEMFPYVINLQLHLPNQQMIWYWQNQDLTHVIHSDNTSRTMLTEFFRMNSDYTEARKYLYKEFPEHYVWNQQPKCWTPRKKKEAIGRVNLANPSEGERFYLRLLLNNVRGPTSFKDLLCVDGIECKTFKEAAQKRGILKSDDAISDCLRDSALFHMPIMVRKLFAMILVYCQPGGVRKLWADNFQALSEDFQKSSRDREYLTFQTLKSVDSFLQTMGKSIMDYDMPEIGENYVELNGKHQREVADEYAIQTPPEDLDAPNKLNFEQYNAYTTILESVNLNKGGVFFIDGPGGTGKTFLYRALLATIRTNNQIALATATSGVAAAILPGGRTAHSRFKIPIIIDDSSICNFSKQSEIAELIRRAKLIIWDEAPMAKRQAIEALDRTLKDIIGNSESFGGKVVVFGGDFRQVLPVVPRGTRTETVDASLVMSYLWPEMKKMQLTTNMRARNDTYFSEYLLRVGNGEESTEHEDLIQIPDEMVVQYEDEDKCEAELIKEIFPSLQHHGEWAEYITQRAILATKNDIVDKLNEKLIEEFPGESVTYYSFDSATDNTDTPYPEDFLNSLAPNGLPPHELVLKKNCPIMLLRNLNPSQGECNGTRLVCRQFQKNVILAEIAVGQFAGSLVPLPRIPLYPAETDGYPFHLKREQFPIRLCFAMTINKSQGQTIPYVGVYLPEPVFSHGQLYVALSRGISMSTTKVLVRNHKAGVKSGSYTKNIVYKEVLLPNR